jgi:hypothetical protein
VAGTGHVQWFRDQLRPLFVFANGGCIIIEKFSLRIIIMPLSKEGKKLSITLTF